MKNLKDNNPLVLPGNNEELSEVSRRRFIQGLGVSAAGLAGAGLLIPGAARAASDDPKIDFINTNCGQDNQNGPRILVGYASCCGTTGEIADAIGKQLCKAGARADVKLMKEVADPSVYDGFVLGSAIQAGRWLADGADFIGDNKKLLAKKKTAYFIACMAMSSDSPKSRDLAEGYVKSVMSRAPKVEPIALGTFAGAVFYDKMPKKYHSIMKRIVKEGGDFRNYDAIRSWADSIAPALLKG